jgi:branched-chain amino acid transport system ATP-binding protein
MLEIENISVRFGGVVALDDVGARIGAPIVGLIGPNGAGKTTLLNVLSGFQRPMSGTITLDGVPLSNLAPAARARSGLRRMFQQERVVETLSVWDNIRAVADHLGRGDRPAQIRRALELTGMLPDARLIGLELNLFQRRLTEIARTLIGEPRLILLDEPAAGLDEAESVLLRQTISSIPEVIGARIIIIDHDTDLIADLCEETMVLDFGRQIAFGPTRAVLDAPEVRAAYLGVPAHG